MTVGINFSKPKAEYLLGCLADGSPIEGIRTMDDMLVLAGACFFVAMSHGPIRLRDVPWSELPTERREAGEEQFFADLHAAVDFYSHLTMLVRDGIYDRSFALDVKALVSGSGEGTVVKPLEGFLDSKE